MPEPTVAETTSTSARDQTPDMILFDFWGVFGLIQSPTDVAAMAEQAHAPLDRFKDAYWAERHPYDSGGSARDYWSRVAARLRTGITAQDMGKLIEMDGRSWQRIDSQMVGLAAELAGNGRRLALLSNAPWELVPFVRNGPLSQFVPQMMFSCEIGSAKPDSEIFHAALQALGTAPQQVLFVDDNASNVRAAELLGMRGLLHQSYRETRRRLLRAV